MGARPVAPEVRTDEMPVPAPKGGASTGTSPSVVIVSRAAAPVTPPVAPASAWTEPEPPRPTADEPTLVARTVDGPNRTTTRSPPDPCRRWLPRPTTPRLRSTSTWQRSTPAPEPVSRPLSDPDLTPLMGIPIIRPVAVDAPAAPVAVPEVPHVPEPAVPDVPPVEFPAPSPRVTDTLVADDDVVFLQPSAPTGTFPVVRHEVAAGSPQPVWFRVVRRDGEPVPAAVVALLDDHGREVDTAKTAVDGGGELHSPHAGRFLMIVSADGYQPRAAILSVDDKPVELALLLPRLGRGRRHGALRGRGGP